MADALTSRMGRAWIQKNRANSVQQMVECAMVGDISEGEGGRELILCFDTDGQYQVKGATQGPPEVITYSVENLLTKDENIFEDLKKCPFAFYINQVECGRQDDPDNYVRQLRLTNNLRTTQTYVGMVGRNEDAESMYNLDIEALPKAAVFLELNPLRMTTTEDQALNDIRGNNWFECNPDCQTPFGIGDYLIAGADSAVGPATGNVQMSTDTGVTWAAGGTDPLGAGIHVMSLEKVRMSGTTVRYICVGGAVGGTQGTLAYGDGTATSLPSSWTTVNIGGAAAGHGAAYGGAIWATDRYNIWIASAAGYIYKSTDGGATITAKESAGVGAGDYNYVHFDPSGKYGVAVGAADQIAVSGNGGESWQAATATATGDDILCAWRLSKNKIWIGTDEGNLFYSTDAGTTWTQRTGWVGSGVGDVRDLHWLDEYTGYMAVNNATPLGAILRTTNGGYTWNVIADMPDNDGINKIWIAKNNLGFAVGEVVDAGTAFICKFAP
jgi:photosystem II stability/assembly factor-like uncharacterized protein